MAGIGKTEPHAALIVERKLPVATGGHHFEALRFQRGRNAAGGVPQPEDKEPRLHLGSGVSGTIGGGVTMTASGTWSFFHCIDMRTRVAPDG